MLMDKINVAEWVSRKISLFGKMQRGRSPSFELFQLDMYETPEYCYALNVRMKTLKQCHFKVYNFFFTLNISWFILFIRAKFNLIPKKLTHQQLVITITTNDSYHRICMKTTIIIDKFIAKFLYNFSNLLQMYPCVFQYGSFMTVIIDSNLT